MMTRRVFLKNGSLALVSLGFAPAFIARAAQAAQARQKILVAIFQRGAVDGLNMVVPFGESAYYANRPSIAIPRPERARRRARSRRLLRPAPADGARSQPLFKRRRAGDRPCVRLARRHALALRRAGLHGERHAGREEHARRLAEPLPAREGARRTRAPFRAVALAPQLPRTLQGTAPALAIGQLGQFGVRAGTATRHDGDVVRGAVRAGRRLAARRRPARKRSTPSRC